MSQQSSTKGIPADTTGDDAFHGWKEYPLNLPGDSAEADLSTYYARLCVDAQRLFSASIKVQTLAIDYPHTPNSSSEKAPKDIDTSNHKSIRVLKNTIDTTEDLEKYLPVYSESASVFFTIKPRFSFGKLLVSEEVLRKLLTYFKVLPEFLDLLHLFGQKTAQHDEDFGVYKHYITNGDSKDCTTFELCYNLKCMEKRQDINNPERIIWTTRKMGIYSKNHPSRDHTTWILLQPSEYFLWRLEGIFASDGNQESPKRRHDLEIHLLAIQSANRNWTPYINYLERKFRIMNEKFLLWCPPDSRNLEIQDIQLIHFLRNILLQLSHALDINHGIITSMRESLQVFRDEEEIAYASGAEFNKYDTSLKSYQFQITQQKNRVENLIRHVDGLFSLIPNILARRENSIMLKVSEKATQYASSMKVITVLTMIYLPPSLIAGIFGMQIITWEPGNSPKIAPEIGYYLIVTVALMAFTWVVYRLWEKRIASKGYDEETPGSEEL